MKSYYTYLISLIILGALFTSCENDEPPFYDQNSDGVYFDYESTEDLTQNINFADHILGNPQEVTVTLNLKLVGYLSGETRKAVLKAKEVEGYEKAEVILPEIVFGENEYEKEVEIKVVRPAQRDTEYAACIYLDAEDPASQLGSGIEGFEAFTVYVTEEYEEPESWNQYAFMYLGDFSAEKHIFMVNLTENNDYASAAAYELAGYNMQAVAALRAQHEETGEPVTIDIPFVSDWYCNYEEAPSYWGDLHNKYMGAYTSGVFVSVCQALQVNTANESEKLDVGEDALQDYNQMLVVSMLQRYNELYMGWRLPGISYKDQMWIPMFTELVDSYELIQPSCWDATTAEFTGKYYGDYSVEKYRFMIKCWLEEKGDDFVLVQMFPICLDQSYMTSDVMWDETIGGEEGIKACYKLFVQKYNEAPEGTYNFTFPDLPIE